MKKINVLAIAPYDGMRDTMVNVAENFDNINVTAFTGDLKQGLEVLLSQNQSDYDVILSRGGTAQILKEHAEIPVMEVSLSHYDILSAIKLAQQCNEKFAVLGFPSISNFARMLCDVLKYDVKIITLNCIDDAYEKINELREEGIGLFIGDVITSSYAKKIGCNSILITSSAASISETFEKITQTFSFYANFKDNYEIYRIFFEEKCEGLDVITEDGEIVFSYGLGEQTGVQNYLRNLIIKNKKCSKDTILKCINDTYYSISFWRSSYQSKVCYYCYLKKINKFPYTKIKGVKAINRYEFANKEINFYYNRDMHPDFDQKINTATNLSTCVAIIGEKGTGKELIASIIYKKSVYNKNPLYVIDCNLLDSKAIKHLLKDEDSPLFLNEITICIKNITSLTKEDLDKLRCHLLDSNCMVRNKVIFIYDLEYENTNIDNEFLDLINKFKCQCLNIEPLRHKVKEIQSIASLYINDINNKKGTQLVGIEPAAMSLLEGYRWPYNIDQLKRVLIDAASKSKLDPYISFETVYKIISEEKQMTNPSKDSVDSLNLEGTLEEITHNVVLSILKDENNNQTKAAQRLGISRTTLWRILNKNS